MENIFFWNSWNKPNRYLYLVLLSIFTAGVFMFIACYFIGINGVVDLDIFSKLENTKVNIDEFSRNLLSFSVQADSYLIKEWYGASAIKVIPLYSYIFFGITFIALLFTLTSFTFLDTFWYTVGMAGFILFLVNLNTEVLNIFFPNSRYFLIGLIVVYGSLSYYFKAFNQSPVFFTRLLSFLAITIIAGFFLFHFSKVSAPFLYISNYGIPGAVIISLLFIIIISYDIIQGFFYLLTSSKNINTKNISLHLSLVSIIYLINLLFLLLKKIKIVDWDIIYLNPFLLFLVSAIIGVWAFKQKEILFKGIFSFQPVGAFLYMSFGIICLFTISYCFITGNDSLVETFEYGIIYSHLCVGSTFLIYLLLNFSDLFHTNIPLYKKVYQPRRTPFFVVYAGGIFAMAALFLQSNRLPFNIYLAGYMNNVGDIYTYEKDYPLAREYYINGAFNDYENWRSNYSLASISLMRDEVNAAVDYYAQSNIKHPSEYSYLNLSNIYMDKDYFFPAKFALEDGLKKFPESTILYNNLALLYSKTALLDSTVHYLKIAQKYSNEQVPKANLLYSLIKHKVLNYADSIYNATKPDKDAGFTANGISVYNSLSKKYEGELKNFFIKNSSLTNQSFACLYNYAINKIQQQNEELIKKIDTLEKNLSNEPYAEDLRYLKSLYYYYNGDKEKGITLLQDLKNYAGNSATIYSNTLGMWLMENGSYNEAAENLKQAISLTDQDTYLNYCVALAEAGKKQEALDALKSLNSKGSKEIKIISNHLSIILSLNKIDSILILDEPLRLQYFHLRKNDFTDNELLSIYSSFKNEMTKFIAASELMNIYIKRNEIQKCRQLWNANQHNINKEIFAIGLINYQYLRLLVSEKEWKELRHTLDIIYLNKNDADDKYYFKAVLAESNNEILNAENLFKTALKMNPFNEDAIIAAVNLYNKQNKILDAYNILVEAQNINPSSVKIIKAYALQALKINLENYGDIALDKLQPMVGEREFKEFKNSYEQARPIF